MEIDKVVLITEISVNINNFPSTRVLFDKVLCLFGQHTVRSKHLFRHASVSSTYPCKLVGPSVGWLVGWSVTLSDFQSLVSNGRSNQKSSKNKVHLFSNFASGRTLPTQSTGPQPIQLVPKNCFFTEISVSVAQIKKIQKT